MNRLTRKDESGRYYVDSKDIGFYSTSRDENGRCTFGGEHVDKLAKYEDLGTIEELHNVCLGKSSNEKRRRVLTSNVCHCDGLRFVDDGKSLSYIHPIS